MPKARQWKICTAPEEPARALGQAAGLPAALAGLLLQRGFCTPQAVDAFLHPKLSGLSDPFGLPDMGRAVDRIWKAVDAQEIITVFGDYDVDGVTAAALMTRVLRRLGAAVRSFIPDRIDEGYGLSEDALQRCIQEHGARVVLSVDCGVNSVDAVRHAQEQGVDVIVTDHHEPGTATAPAFALINPKLGEDPSLEILSGVGVAFKLAHGLVKRGRELKKPAAAAVDLRDYLDLAALGTVADIVPLRGENRILVRYGLARLARTEWPGLDALKSVAGVKGELETYHLGFQLGPRINASGRIGQPMEALELLVTSSRSDAWRIARELDETNAERRRIERDMAEEAFAEIDGYFDPAEHFGLVVARAGWHPGVVGIVASRVARHYHRPAIIMGIDEDGAARGSCRSIEGYDLLDGLGSCRRLLTKFGGHKMAAGLEVKPGRLEDFKRQFNEAVKAVLAETDLIPRLRVDGVLEPEEVCLGFMEELKALRPFGQDNPEPVWAMRGMAVSGSPRVVGENHLKLSLVCGGRSFDAIAFQYPLADLPQGPVDVAFVLKENRWRGSTSLQLQVRGIRKADNPQ